MERVQSKKPFSGFQKDGILAELQARVSRDCRFLVFYHHNYQLSLRVYDMITRTAEISSLPSKNFPCISTNVLQIGALVLLGRLV